LARDSGQALQCQHHCFSLPGGPQCKCAIGYQLDAKQTLCNSGKTISTAQLLYSFLAA